MSDPMTPLLRYSLLRHTGAPDDPSGCHYDLLLEDGETCRDDENSANFANLAHCAQHRKFCRNSSAQRHPQTFQKIHKFCKKHKICTICCPGRP